MKTFDIEKFRRDLIAEGKAMERSLTTEELQEIGGYMKEHPHVKSTTIRKKFAKKFGLVSITEVGLAKVLFYV